MRWFLKEANGPGKLQVKVPHQRSPYAMKFEERSHEETDRQERCAEAGLGTLPKKRLQAQRERQNYFLLACGRMKRVFGRFWS